MAPSLVKGETILRVVSEDGEILVETKKVYKHKRVSMSAAAKQKDLDKLFRPGATEGQIVEWFGCVNSFKFKNGVSQYTGSKSWK